MPEASNLILRCLQQDWILNSFDVNCTFIGHIVENITRRLCSFASLLVAKNEIDPVVKVLTDVVTLKSLALLCDEVFR